VKTTPEFQFEMPEGNEFVSPAPFNRNAEKIEDILLDNSAQISHIVNDKADKTALWNPNILINSDFRNKVSIVNQRGFTSQNVPNVFTYTVDMWRVNLRTITVNDGYITLDTNGPPASAGMFSQYIENGHMFGAGVYTFSIIARNRGVEQIGSRVRDRHNNLVGYIIIPPNDEFRLYSTTFTIEPDQGISVVDLAIANVGISSIIDIAAVKLELGSVSTLANDPPQDYGKELAVCQRYQWKPINNTRVRAVAVASDYLVFFLPTPQQLRIIPVMTDGNVHKVMNLNGHEQTGFTFSVVNNSGNGLYIEAHKQSHGLSDGSMHVGMSNVFDANL